MLQHQGVPAAGADAHQFELQRFLAVPAVQSQVIGHIHLLGQEVADGSPAPGHGPHPGLPLAQGQLQVSAPQFPLLADGAAAAPEQWGGVADAEGFEPLQFTPEGPVDLLELQQGFRHNQLQAFPFPPGLRQVIQAFMQGCDPLRFDGEAPRGRVTAEALQQIAAGLEGGIHGKAFGGPHGRAHPPIPLGGQ